MSDASPAPTTPLSPLGQAAQQEGIGVTQMLIVADVKRSVSFYRDVLGATVLREHSRHASLPQRLARHQQRRRADARQA